MDRTEANSGTREVTERLRFDEAALERWLASHVEGFSGPLTVSQFKGGQSNPTYRIDAAARSYVLRRKPPGKLLPGAHAVDREYRVHCGARRAGFPRPESLRPVRGRERHRHAFYVMDMVDGPDRLGSAFSGHEPRASAPPTSTR